MIRTAILGPGRLGRGRSLLDLLEARSRGEIDVECWERGSAQVRVAQRESARCAGISEIPSGDFELLDPTFELARAFGATRPGVGPRGEGLAEERWFRTRYHYLVPEVSAATSLELRFNRTRRAFQEALAAGVRTRPTLLGPVSFLCLSRNPEAGGPAPLSRLGDLVPVYAQLLRELAEAGTADVQLDEPLLGEVRAPELEQSYRQSYEILGREPVRPRLHLTSGFGSVVPCLGWLSRLPVEGLHLDLCSAPEQLDLVERAWPSGRDLSVGVIDGGNVWRADLASIVEGLRPLVRSRGAERLVVATSCSLLHCPWDLDDETDLDDELRSWLAFGKQKMQELSVIARALAGDHEAVRGAIDNARAAAQSRHNNPRVHRAVVEERVGGLAPRDFAAAEGSPSGAWQGAVPELGFAPSSFEGIAPTRSGWLQTGPTSAARSAIVYGDVSWHAAGEKRKGTTPVTLQGPVTIIRELHIREDQPFGKTALELALGRADEVEELVRSGVRVVQLDDRALRAELASGRDPVRVAEGVDAFRLWVARAVRTGATVVVHPDLAHGYLASRLRARGEQPRSAPLSSSTGAAMGIT